MTKKTSWLAACLALALPAVVAGQANIVEPFMALVIYPTTADAQSRHADNLVRLVSERGRTLRSPCPRPTRAN